MIEEVLRPWLDQFIREDQLDSQIFYLSQLPKTPVHAKFYIKSDLVFAGAPFVEALFKNFGVINKEWSFLAAFEGKKMQAGTVIEFPFEIPFDLVLGLERVALNLIQHASSVATYTAQYVKKAEPYGISILETRKTTPGLRLLEKYAVKVGGGENHRYSQTDCWMIKDNHKVMFGGLEGAFQFFKAVKGFYRPIICEIHNKEELVLGLSLGIKHFLLDNFSADQIKQMVSLKPEGVTYEVSGGVTLNNIDDYLIEGVDAISIGALTYGAPAVDISFKYGPKK